MKSQLPLFPESASSVAPQVDALFYAWTAVSIFFTALIAVLIIYFMARYRRRHEDEVGLPERAPVWLEIAWSVIPLLIALAMFAWGTQVFVQIYRPPADAVVYYGVGKQWMWKFQHPDGQREINTLHVPLGQAIQMKLTSEDVIHSFFVPAFRVKQDAVPGRYSSVWFRATRPGVYHLFCAEYCGGEHSRMIGSVVVLEPQQYEEWLAGGPAGQPLTASGAELFQQLTCQTCHGEGGSGAGMAGMAPRAPSLVGLYNRQVALADGRKVVADDSYIRESILNPMAKVTAGWQPIMPTFQGQVTEEQLTQLISYVKSLSGEGGAEAGGGTAEVGTAGGQMGTPAPQAGPQPQ
ncbi:MAG TPA: cytochrome c oxidase subunit II [Thermoanaerobaculia bacterium]|nr:cytochrome c oxidase subunit II [Thermoanaerobaculia bacterium]